MSAIPKNNAKPIFFIARSISWAWGGVNGSLPWRVRPAGVILPSMPLFRRAIPFLLAAALAVTAHAGVVAPSGSVFAPPGGAWSGPLGMAFADPALSPFLPSGLSFASLTPSIAGAPAPTPTLSPEVLRSAAPLVQSLAKSLAITPKALAAMDPDTRRNAVEMAVEEARETVRQKAYELAETARALSRPDRTMDKETRAKLYAAVSSLMEMRDFYGPWLDKDGAAAVEDGFTLASARAWQVRTALLAPDDEAVSRRTHGRHAAPEPNAAATAPAAPLFILDPGATAMKLREDMKNNKSGWGQSDLDTLYRGYGFVLREGGKHRMYTHTAFPQLHESVSRQNDLPPGYAQSALKLLTELERLTADQTKTAAAPATGPPVNLALADLSILLSQPKEKPSKPAVPVIETTRKHNPEAVPARVAVKTAPESPAAAAPSITPTLAPSTPKVVEVKAEPPAVKSAPEKPASMIERIKITWGRIKSDSN
jgi:hypothetical protein